jgi:hypothetical protein
LRFLGVFFPAHVHSEPRLAVGGEHISAVIAGASEAIHTHARSWMASSLALLALTAD